MLSAADSAAPFISGDAVSGADRFQIKYGVKTGNDNDCPGDKLQSRQAHLVPAIDQEPSLQASHAVSGNRHKANGQKSSGKPDEINRRNSIRVYSEYNCGKNVNG